METVNSQQGKGDISGQPGKPKIIQNICLDTGKKKKDPAGGIDIPDTAGSERMTERGDVDQKRE